MRSEEVYDVVRLLGDAAIEPYYQPTNVEAPIVLYEGRVRAVNGDESVEGEATIYFEWRPAPRLRLRFASHGGIPGVFDPNVATAAPRFTWLDVPEGSVPEPPGGNKLEPTGDFTFRSSMYMSIAGSHGDPKALRRLVVNLINLDVRAGNSLVRYREYSEHGRLTLESPRWRVTIDKWPHQQSVLEALRDSGGYAFTHVAEIERPDGHSFSAGEADEALDALFHLLALGRGTLVGVTLPVGFDASGKAVWTSWRTTLANPWRSRFSWLDPHKPDALIDLWPTLLERYADDFWKTVLNRTIRYYILANQPNPVEIATVSAHIGLELMAWAVLIQKEHWLSTRDQIEASSQLRLLLKWAGIPTQLPSELPRLDAFARARTLEDGPSVAAWFRNRAVHPPRRTIEWPDSRDLDECWRLTTWYLELVILRILGYSGSYGPRIRRVAWSNDAEPVPWVPEGA